MNEKLAKIYDRCINNQEINLEIQTKQQELIESAESLERIRRTAVLAAKNGLDKETLDLWKDALDIFRVLDIDEEKFRNASPEDQVNVLNYSVANYRETVKNSISRSLSNLLTNSIKDLDATHPGEMVSSARNEKRLVYNRYACETFADTFQQILLRLSFVPGLELSYKKLKEYIKDKMSGNLHMLNTKISQEGYTVMSLPRPEVKKMSDADWTSVASINGATEGLESVAYPVLIDRLNSFVRNVGKRIRNASDDLVDEIKYHCLVAQIISSTKNMMRTLQESHQAMTQGLQKN